MSRSPCPALEMAFEKCVSCSRSSILRSKKMRRRRRVQRAPEKAAAIALLTAAAFRPTELLVGSAGPFCLLLLLARAAFCGALELYTNFNNSPL